MHSVLFPCLSFFIFLSCLQRTCSANSLLNSQQFPGYGQFPYQNNNNNGQQFGGFAQQQSFMPQGNPTNYLDDEVPARDKSALSQLSLSEIINRLLPCQVSGESVLVEPVVFKYHNYSSLTAFLQTFAAQYPGISRLYSAGKSTLKRELWVLEISNKPGVHQPGIYYDDLRLIAWLSWVLLAILLRSVDWLVDGGSWTKSRRQSSECIRVIWHTNYSVLRKIDTFMWRESFLSVLYQRKHWTFPFVHLPCMPDCSDWLIDWLKCWFMRAFPASHLWMKKRNYSNQVRIK